MLRISPGVPRSGKNCSLHASPSIPYLCTENSSAVLNKKTAVQYFQYAKQQYRSVLDGSGGGVPESKRFYHSIRLLKEVRSILSGGEVSNIIVEDLFLQPRVFWEGEEREQIMSIRRGEWENSAVLDLIKDLEVEVGNLMVSGALIPLVSSTRCQLLSLKA